MPKYSTLAERLLANSYVDESGCWVWTGKRSCRGDYGHINIRQGDRHVTCKAHRIAYRELSGKRLYNGERWHIDHICRNPLCINPQHLRQIRADENLRRRKEKRTPAQRPGRK